MKKIFYSLSLLICSASAFGQVVVGSANNNTPSVKKYAGLEVKSDKPKGFLPPVVSLTDITSKTVPIKNPVDGMLVYNHGSIVTPGLYVWVASKNRGNGEWSQLADTSNVINSMLLETSTDFDILENVPIGQQVSLLNNNYNIITNQIGAKLSNKGLTLVGNSGYIISITMDISVDYSAIPNYATKGIGDTDIYSHNYVLELRDINGKVYGAPVNISAVSRAGYNNNQHSIYTIFSFPITIESVTIFPHISYENKTNVDGNKTNGGSYYTGFPAGNTGKVTVKNVNIQIERGVLSL